MEKNSDHEAEKEPAPPTAPNTGDESPAHAGDAGEAVADERPEIDTAAAALAASQADPTYDPDATLRSVIAKYKLEVPESVVPQLEQYVQSMWEANTVLNLTRHVTFEKFVTRDLVDTLEISKLIPENKEVLDIGSGGGVPGLVLAILRPDLTISLSDSVGKKANALSVIADECSLDIEIYQCRSEQLLEDFSFDYTTARAVGPLVKICTWLFDVWPSVGKLLAIKGPNWKNEKNLASEKSLLKKVDVELVSEYPTPGTDWKSVILQIKSKRHR